MGADSSRPDARRAAGQPPAADRAARRSSPAPQPRTPGARQAPRLRFDRAEAGGALGDLGTFIPLLVGMVNRCGLQLGPALFCSGLLNVISGLVFGIPIPVQPMKAIAAVAIGEGLNEAQILSAGIVTGAAMLLLALSGLVQWLSRAIPRSVVRGLQLAIGLKLVIKGVEMIGGTRLLGWDSIALGVICGLLVLVFYFSRRVPAALLVFAIGAGALLAAQPALLEQTRLGMSWALPQLSDWHDWRNGMLRGALPQVPLTLLNSVIAVCALSADLFPGRRAAPRRVATSVALMNLVCCPLGGMPVCHGAGGLAAQYRFGARTGGSMVMLGLTKMALALLLGGSLLAWLREYPRSVLGVLLLFSGLELALVCRDQTARVGFFVMVLTAGTCLAINTAAGFVLGWSLAGLLLWGLFRVEPPPTDPPPAGP